MRSPSNGEFRGGALPTLQHLSGQTKVSWAKENYF